MRTLKSALPGLLLLVAVGCGGSEGGGSLLQGTAGPSGSSSTVPPAGGATTPTDIAGFLARSGNLGTANLNDRSLARGRYLVFASRQAMVPEDTNNLDDVYVRDLRTAQTRLVSLTPGGGLSNGVSSQASISADGRYVVFRSAASNLVASDGNGTVEDIFLRDLNTNTTRLVSLPEGGGSAAGASMTPAVSNGGRYVVFSSLADNLVAGDTGQQDVFLRDTVALTTIRISSQGTTGGQPDGPSFDPAITPSGDFIAFSTEATNLISGQTLNGQRQVVRHARAATLPFDSSDRALISQSSGGAQGNGPSYEPSISDNGTKVAFFSRASNLAGTDNGGFFDVFVRDLGATSTTLVSRNLAATYPNSHSGFPSLSGDGNTVAYGSLATDLLSTSSNGNVALLQTAASTSPAACCSQPFASITPSPPEITTGTVISIWPSETAPAGSISRWYSS